MHTGCPCIRASGLWRRGKRALTREVEQVYPKPQAFIGIAAWDIFDPPDEGKYSYTCREYSYDPPSPCGLLRVRVRLILWRWYLWPPYHFRLSNHLFPAAGRAHPGRPLALYPSASAFGLLLRVFIPQPVGGSGSLLLLLPDMQGTGNCLFP